MMWGFMENRSELSSLHLGMKHNEKGWKNSVYPVYKEKKLDYNDE